MDIPARVAFRVVDDLVRVVIRKPFVRLQFVGVNLRALQHVLPHVGLQLRLLRVVHMLQDDTRRLPALGALQKPLHGRKVPYTGAVVFPLCPLLRVHRPRPTADERLIDFDQSAQLLALAALHREPDAVKHEPSGFLLPILRELILSLHPEWKVADEEPASRD